MSEPKYLRAECGVRYWEDATVNGIKDEEGDLVPCRFGDYWCPNIELETGLILDWPAGTLADIHYKVCDDGRYALFDAAENVIEEIEGYVPGIMCPEGGGYGDYVIMKVGPDGKIENWSADLSAWRKKHEDS